MKPSPYLVMKALTALNVGPGATALIGDSVTDIDAARTAGVLTVGYANKPGKRSILTEHRPSAIVESMSEILLALRRRPN